MTLCNFLRKYTSIFTLILNTNGSWQVAFSRGSGGSNLAKVAHIKRSAGIMRWLSEAPTNDLSRRDYAGRQREKEKGRETEERYGSVYSSRAWLRGP